MRTQTRYDFAFWNPNMTYLDQVGFENMLDLAFFPIGKSNNIVLLNVILSYWWSILKID